MKALVLIDNGFEEIEALTTVDLLRRANIVVDLVSANNKEIVLGSHNISVNVDDVISNINDVLEYDVLVIPGGMPNAALLRDNEDVISFIKKMNENKKVIASICAGPITLQQANVVDNKQVTVYPGFEDVFVNSEVVSQDVVVSENIISAKGVNYALDFALKIIEKVVDKEISDKVALDILRER